MLERSILGLVEAHGSYTIETTGRILTVEGTGPFNEALVREYRRDLEASVEALSPDPWVMLLTLHDLSLCTPEAEAELDEVLKWRSSMGMTKGGLLFHRTVGTEILKERLTLLYVAAGVEFAFFDHIDDARMWLEDLARPAD